MSRPAILKALSHTWVSHPLLTNHPPTPVTGVTVSRKTGVFVENSKRGQHVQRFEVKMQGDINPVLEGWRRPSSRNNTATMHSTVGKVGLVRGGAEPPSRQRSTPCDAAQEAFRA